MRAWQFSKAGVPQNVLKLVDIARPVPKGDEILVEVKAVALNPVGWKSMSMAPIAWFHKHPAVPESDFSGIVAGGKLEGTPFKLGDEVLGITPAETVAKTGNGALAEYTLVEPNALVKKPSNISYVEAASFPLAGLTAWWALVNTAQVKQGSRVLINGATGAVGAWGTQIAKAKGAYVVVTCSGESESLAKKLGADEAIDYKSVNLVQHLKEHYSIKDGKGFDAIFDPVGQQHVFAASASYLKPDGVYLDLFGGVHLDSIGAVISTATGLFNSALRPRFLGGVPRTFKMLMLPAHKMGEELKEATAMLASGQLKATIDSTYPFGDALKAYDRQMSGRSKGKVVITV